MGRLIPFFDSTPCGGVRHSFTAVGSVECRPAGDEGGQKEEREDDV